jgi:hypothetical protein
MAKVKTPVYKKPDSFKGLPGLGKKKRQQPLPKLEDTVQLVANLVDDELANLTRALGGDERLAKRILKLQKKFGGSIQGTVIELIIMDYLDRHNYKYEFQKWLLGGRAIRGGQVVDFAVDMGNRVIVLEPQGGYWHTRPGKVQIDAAQRLALMGTTIWGKKVVVVEIWERRLMDKHLRNPALEAAMAGIEVGR